MATKKKGCSHVELCPKCLGVAFGLVWGIGLFVMALISGAGAYGAMFIGSIGSVYLGYSAGAFGGLLGLVYGFIDGFIGGYLVAWLYNKMSGCC
jgi:hypothetical protein